MFKLCEIKTEKSSEIGTYFTVAVQTVRRVNTEWGI